MSFYFAYGSNMNPRRMSDRGVRYHRAEIGRLDNWQLRFDKMSQKDRSFGFANVQPCWGSHVYGVVYTLDDSELLKLDKFEGYPKHYQKTTLLVHIESGASECVTYIASRLWTTSKLLSINEEYAGHIMSGINEFMNDPEYEDYTRPIKQHLRH